MTAKRKFFAAAALMATVPLMSGLNPAKADEEKVQLMFVQTSEGLNTDDQTLWLINVGQQTLYFSDRPVRIAGLSGGMDSWRRPGQFRQ